MVFQDKHGKDAIVDGKRLIHTDGTGFISENLAKICPNRIIKGKKSKVCTLGPISTTYRFLKETLVYGFYIYFYLIYCLINQHIHIKNDIVPFFLKDYFIYTNYNHHHREQYQQEAF